jgi:DNA-binding protein H-NS
MSDKKMTVAEIEAEIERLKSEIVTRKMNAKTEIRTEIEKMLSDASLTIYDIYPDFVKKKPLPAKGKGAAKASGQVKALYKDPRSGATWAGRGRAPKWVTELCDEKGINLQTFKASSEYRG